MVLLTMTPSMVQALEKLQSLQETTVENDDVPSKSAEEIWQKNKSRGRDQDQEILENRIVSTENAEQQPAEPSLLSPTVGNPISHGQVIDMSRNLNARRIHPSNLETLLRGSKVYVPSPPSKAEPVSDICMKNG